MTEQPTDPTAVRDFVIACADALYPARYAHNSGRCMRTYRSHGSEECPKELAARERLQQAVEWAMARARVEGAESVITYREPPEGSGMMYGMKGNALHTIRKAEADAAEKWAALQ